MRNNWGFKKLGDLIELKYGFGLIERKRVFGKVPVYGSGGIIGYHNESAVKGPGIIVGRKGNVGTASFSKSDFWPIDTAYYIKENKEHYDLKFIFFFLKTLNLNSLDTAAAVPGLSRESFYNIEAMFPPLSIQRKIASILSAYDDLIEVNERRIEILAEMARLIYKEWFVKFRFPGYEKVKMVGSKLGKIPEGWEVTNLGVVLDLIESGSRPKGGARDLLNGIPSIGAENVLGLGKFDFNKIKCVPASFFKNMRSGVIKNGDVLLYKDGAKIGRKTYFDEDFPFKTCCINEHVFILRANKRISQKYLFFWIDQPWVTQEIINLNSNAAQPGINKPSVKTLPIMIPKPEITNLFDEVVTPIIKMLFNYCKQNIIFRQTRDMLLPKLVGGEIDVSDLDIKLRNEEI